MADGKTHDRYNTYAAIAIPALSLVTSKIQGGDPLIDAAILGSAIMIGGIWLSPDVDLPQSRPSQRWSFLNKPVWSMYRMFCGRHRSWLSHIPVIGTYGRLLYLSGIFLLALFGACVLTGTITSGSLDLGLLTAEVTITKHLSPIGEMLVAQSRLINIGISGLIISETIHVILDYVPIFSKGGQKRR